jgi:hypothetical protein
MAFKCAGIKVDSKVIEENEIALDADTGKTVMTINPSLQPG